jgi:hypothetical protein
MSGDFFDRLDAELAELTRQGAHLSSARRERRRRWISLRRGLASGLAIVALAVALAGEFPSAAGGHPPGGRPAPVSTL